LRTARYRNTPAPSRWIERARKARPGVGGVVGVGQGAGQLEQQEGGQGEDAEAEEGDDEDAREQEGRDDDDEHEAAEAGAVDAAVGEGDRTMRVQTRQQHLQAGQLDVAAVEGAEQRRRTEHVGG
jgi:hypothetical protein